LTVTRGPGEIGLDPALCPAPTVLVLVRPFAGYPPRRYARGLSAVVAAVRIADARAVASVLKTTSFISHVLARIEAKAHHADEALLLNQAGFLTEGSVSNLFIVQRGRLLTPAVAQGLLPGVTRAVVLRLGHAAGLTVAERRLRPAALRQADEAFLTNTMLEVMPLVRVDGRPIGSGRPGPITLELRRRYGELTAGSRRG
jgi:branched-subunit amino acid aminotransferase/4-amino-4-deoxychorismate lyase